MSSTDRVVVHESDRHGSFVEFFRTADDATCAILAPHGGQVEPNTDTEAELIAQRVEDVTVWGTRGIVDGSYDGAFARWHTVEETDPLHTFPLYKQCQADEYEMGVSLHVMSEDGIIVGGRASESVREELCDVFERYFPEKSVRLGAEGEPRVGMNRGNFVNSLSTGNPVHIEQSVDIATMYPVKFSRAVAEWMNTEC